MLTLILGGLIAADMDENMKAEAMQTFADQMAKASQRWL